ncbi:hypothetical protein [Allochromatium vinosum]|mgnify:CR=1 FL=1|uniref:hypothetical protein n=1 Tax=Allochromatium vinosum TaxID=1049 RepID=UPI001904F42F|nr:hypothetical protein [Allochromatium vinosum]MBK1656126.1 hypothetical protein [Allochromatium vinosum]
MRYAKLTVIAHEGFSRPRVVGQTLSSPIWIDIDMNNDDALMMQELDVSQRISYYEQELKNISSPSSFRELVLHNVYQCLLTNCQEQHQTPGLSLRH